MNERKMIYLDDAIDAICKHGTDLERRGILVLALVEHKQMTIDLLESLPSAQQWHVIKKRPMTNDERIELSERIGYDIEYEDAFMYSNLPEDGQEVLTCSSYGSIRIDTFENDPDYGCSFEENGDMDGIVAWMPLPEARKGADDD
ncbi:MAG: hypothetical protein IJM90_04565 [Firmicutes bacterium]|nr:hypothetical protein [Bacillota bacterium]